MASSSSAICCSLCPRSLKRVMWSPSGRSRMRGNSGAVARRGRWFLGAGEPVNECDPREPNGGAAHCCHEYEGPSPLSSSTAAFHHHCRGRRADPRRQRCCVDSQHLPGQRCRGCPVTTVDRRHRPIPQLIDRRTALNRAHTPPTPVAPKHTAQPPPTRRIAAGTATKSRGPIVGA